MSPAVCGGPVAVNDIGKYQKDTSRLEQSFLFSGLHQDFSIQHKKQLHLFVQMSGEIHILPFLVKKRVLLLFVKGQHPLPPNLYLVLLYHKIRCRTIGEAKFPAEPALRHAARFAGPTVTGSALIGKGGGDGTLSSLSFLKKIRNRFCVLIRLPICPAAQPDGRAAAIEIF